MPSWLKAMLASFAVGLALAVLITYLYVARWPHG